MEQWLHSYTSHDIGSYLPGEYGFNPSSSTACATSMHKIRASPPSGSTVKRVSSLKSTLQEPLSYHQSYHARKINNLHIITCSLECCTILVLYLTNIGHPSSLKRSESCKNDGKEIMRSNVKELQKMDNKQVVE